MILGYKSPQKFFEGANMCPGRQKKPHPAHGKTHPLVRKHTSGEKILPHFEDWCPNGGDKMPPQLFKGPGPEKRKGLSAWENTHPYEETHFHLMLLHM